ncbi:MAG: hypothetical protein VB858_01650 [Planctomycetaceae bacterium]
MLSGLVMALSVAMTPGQCTTCGPGGGMSFSPGMTSGSWAAGAGGGYNPYNALPAGGGGCGDQLYPYDSPEPWLHGYFQELPAYAGHAAFRPHNYKHILAQLQTASRWGIPTSMPVSHQWYHRYRQRAGMHPGWDTKLSTTGISDRRNYAAAPALQSPVVQTSVPQSYFEPTSAAAYQRGYTGTPIPGIATPTYQQSLATFQSRPTVSQQHQERFAALQSQLEQQTFQIQAMQQQLQQRQVYQQAQSQFHSQPWAQPNHTQFTASESAVTGTANPYAGSASIPQPQSGMALQPQPYAANAVPVYAPQPFAAGAAAPNMLPPVSAQPVAPQLYPPAGPQYSPGQPAPANIPQSTGYLMPGGIPQMTLPPGPAMPGMPLQPNYPQNWTGGRLSSGQPTSSGSAGNPYQAGYPASQMQPYSPGVRAYRIAPAQGLPQGGYQAQQIPGVPSGQYPTVPFSR